MLVTVAYMPQSPRLNILCSVKQAHLHIEPKDTHYFSMGITYLGPTLVTYALCFASASLKPKLDLGSSPYLPF